MLTKIAGLALAAVLAAASASFAQETVHPEIRAQQLEEQAEALMHERRYREALAAYQEAMRHVPPDPQLLYNAGLAAYLADSFATAAEMWERLRDVVPDDWRIRTKLVQTYEELGNLEARDREREAIFELRKQAADEELAEQVFYCRQQFTVNGRRVMAFEYFEMTGPRALRYVFYVLDDEGEEDFRISLGSYDLTNSIWARENQEAADRGERLFHLDGYFDWGHATYGFFHPEPSYEKVREQVVAVLSEKLKPGSATILPRRSKEKKE